MMGIHIDDVVFLPDAEAAEPHAQFMQQVNGVLCVCVDFRLGIGKACLFGITLGFYDFQVIGVLVQNGILIARFGLIEHHPKCIVAIVQALNRLFQLFRIQLSLKPNSQCNVHVVSRLVMQIHHDCGQILQWESAHAIFVLIKLLLHPHTVPFCVSMRAASSLTVSQS